MTDSVQIGDATLYHGDCLDIIPTLPIVDAVITDPPYGISDAPNTHVDRADGRRGPRGGRVNTWHAESRWDRTLDPTWLPAAMAMAHMVVLFGHWRKRGDFEGAVGKPARAEIVWAKDMHTGAPCPVAPRDERIWVFSDSAIKPATFETSVWDCPVIPTWSHKHHKNEKPLALMRRLVAWTGAADVVDCFMGSGTTGVACAEMGKRFVGIEREREHFDIACERIENAYRQTRMFA